jgi:hypothetical protein
LRSKPSSKVPYGQFPGPRSRAGYHTEERGPRYAGTLSLQQPKGTGASVGLKPLFGRGSSKKSEFTKSSIRCQLEEVVSNLEQAVRTFKNNDK